MVNRHRFKTVANIVKTNLCNGCGVCAGICKNDAIVMTKRKNGFYYPEINQSKCIQCSFCYRICPVTDCVEINRSFQPFSNKYYSGNYKNIYVGYSNDENIRRRSASGGLVTSVLLNLLKRRIIDGAVVTKMSSEDPYRTESYIAKTQDEIMDAMQSKYNQVSLGKPLRNLKHLNGKYALVGLPCHIQAVKKAQQYIKYLKDKIVCFLGLFCGQGVSENFTRFLELYYKDKCEKLTEVSYREGEWWRYNIKFKYGTNGNFRIVPFHGPVCTILSQERLFSQRYCFLCNDVTSELADISFGDAWLPEYKGNKEGYSIIISRDDHFESLLKDMSESGTITLEKSTFDKLMLSQEGPMLFKKEKIFSRILLSKLFFIKVPKYNLRWDKKTIKMSYKHLYGSLIGYLKRYYLKKRRYHV